MVFVDYESRSEEEKNTSMFFTKTAIHILMYSIEFLKHSMNGINYVLTNYRPNGTAENFLMVMLMITTAVCMIANVRYHPSR